MKVFEICGLLRFSLKLPKDGYCICWYIDKALKFQVLELFDLVGHSCQPLWRTALSRKSYRPSWHLKTRYQESSDSTNTRLKAKVLWNTSNWLWHCSLFKVNRTNLVPNQLFLAVLFNCYLLSIVIYYDILRFDVSMHYSEWMSIV